MMRTLHLVLAAASVLLVGSNLICGYWIHGSGKVTDLAGSVNFHATLGTAAALTVLATAIVTFVRK